MASRVSKTETDTSHGGSTYQTQSGGASTHISSEGARTDLETQAAFEVTRRNEIGVRGKTSTRTTSAVTVTSTRTARQHRVLNHSVSGAVDVTRKAYAHDGFGFTFEVPFPNRKPRDLSGGAGDLLSCPA